MQWILSETRGATCTWRGLHFVHLAQPIVMLLTTTTTTANAAVAAISNFVVQLSNFPGVFSDIMILCLKFHYYVDSSEARMLGEVTEN